MGAALDFHPPEDESGRRQRKMQWNEFNSEARLACAKLNLSAEEDRLVMLADREVAELISKWPLGGPSRTGDSDTPRAANRTRPYRDFLSDRSSIAPLALTIASIVSATAPSVVLGDAHNTD
jgi:hypothetical protein